MKTKRTLALKRETLAELDRDDLTAVAGAGELTPVVRSIPLRDCLLMTSPCPSQPPGCMP